MILLFFGAVISLSFSPLCPGHCCHRRCCKWPVVLRRCVSLPGIQLKSAIPCAVNPPSWTAVAAQPACSLLSCVSHNFPWTVVPSGTEVPCLPFFRCNIVRFSSLSSAFYLTVLTARWAPSHFLRRKIDIGDCSSLTKITSGLHQSVE